MEVAGFQYIGAAENPTFELICVYQCPCCSNVMDRDLNSAILEKAAGMSVLKACGAAP